MTTATATPTRKTARPTHGTCRLIPACHLPLPAALDAGEALLSILPERGEPTNYTVLRLSDPDGRTVGFRLTRLAAYIVDRKVYDIDATPGYGWQCDCPDALYQDRECKHVHALRACLARAGIAVPTPQRQHAAEPPRSEATAASEENRCFDCGQPSADFYCDRCGNL